MVRSKVIMVVVVLCVLFSGGCDLAMLQKDDVVKTSNAIEVISQKLDVVQEGMTEWAKATGQNVEKITELNSDIDKYQDTLIDAKKAFDEAPTVIEGAIAANQASAPINPYAGMVDIILKTILGLTTTSTVVAGTVAVNRGKKNKNLNTEKDELTTKYKATNKANEILRVRHPDIAEEHYRLVGDVRSGKDVSVKGVA